MNAKRLSSLLVGALVVGVALVTGCNSSSSSGSSGSSSTAAPEPSPPASTEISGPARLQVINDFHITQTILFNNQNIGTVASGAQRTWNVPTGTHRVTARDSVTGDSSGTYTFAAGQTTVVRVHGVAGSARVVFEGLEDELLGLPDEKALE